MRLFTEEILEKLRSVTVTSGDSAIALAKLTDGGGWEFYATGLYGDSLYGWLTADKFDYSSVHLPSTEAIALITTERSFEPKTIAAVKGDLQRRLLQIPQESVVAAAKPKARRKRETK